MTTSEVIEQLGGCRVVADLMNEEYQAVYRWYKANKVPAWKLVRFVEMANQNGLSIKVVDLK
jgi:hypothetical protein